jgi:hypothetical protein
MKIIQSFWSANNNNIYDSRGWFSAKYHWLSWVLSVNQLRKHHEDVELYTDEFGYKILIEKLQLPYTKVHVVLDELNHYPQGFWAIAKIKTYSLQSEPFIHVDGDVFVWESLTEKFKNADLVTQNMEHTTDYYGKFWRKSTKVLIDIPKSMQPYHKGRSEFAFNMGIIGGNDVNFLQKYCKESFNFLENNKAVWSELEKNNFNVFFEQVLLYNIAKKENIKCDFLFDKVYNENMYVGFGKFEDVPYEKQYLHFLGDYKKQLSNCIKMEKYVLKHYPEYFIKCLDLIDEIIYKKENIIINKRQNNNLVNSFIDDLKNKTNSISEVEYLLARDIHSVDLINSYDKRISNHQPIILHLLNGIKKDKVTPLEVLMSYEFHENPNLKYDKVDAILISEINEKSIIFDTDEVDDVMIHELKKPILYQDFIDKIVTYYEEEEGKEEFLKLVNYRLRRYIVLKIITVY